MEIGWWKDEGAVTNLLEPNVHVKGERLPRMTDGRNAELTIRWSTARNQLHSIGTRIVPYLTDIEYFVFLKSKKS